MGMLLKALLSNNFFLKNLLNVLKIQTVKISVLKAMGLKLGHFDIFGRLFPFLAFVEFLPIIL